MCEQRFGFIFPKLQLVEQNNIVHNDIDTLSDFSAYKHTTEIFLSHSWVVFSYSHLHTMALLYGTERGWCTKLATLCECCVLKQWIYLMHTGILYDTRGDPFTNMVNKIMAHHAWRIAFFVYHSMAV